MGSEARRPFAARVVRSRAALVGGGLAVLIGLIAVFAPWVTPYDPFQMAMAQRLEPPSIPHPLGTDMFGRDLWARMALGARYSLVVAFLGVAIASVIGVSVGLLAGYYGGWVDTIVSRVVDVFLAFPVILLALALIAALGPSPINAMIAIGLVYWTTYARVVRVSVLAVRHEEYVLAAHAVGVPDARILIRHLLPNVLAPVIVLATLGMGGAIVIESTLSFLGLGVQPPAPSWGWSLALGMRYMRQAPHLAVVPGVAIMLTVLAFNLLGDGVRDLTDARGRTR
ncbi:MAG TPA: nickel transporter permease [bacterium]|nr:nickel transporter permease [bacterium]